MKKLALILFFLCCCENNIHNGIVVSKEIIPEHTTIVMSHVGKTTIPTTVYHATEYLITVEKKIPVRRTVNVNEGEYSSVQIGDSLNLK